MMYRVEYGLYDIHCGGRQFIWAENMERAQHRAGQLARQNFLRKVGDGRIRFSGPKTIPANSPYSENLNDDDRGRKLYWLMIDDHIWYKVEEALDPPSLMPREEWEEF